MSSVNVSNRDGDDFVERLSAVFLLGLLGFAMVAARIGYLTITYPLLDEIHARQSARRVENRQIATELLSEISKLDLDGIALERLRLETERKYRESNVALDKEKDRLLREIDNLKTEQRKMAAEMSKLQRNIDNLLKFEEDSIEQILEVYNRISEKENKYNFVINFLLGAVASIVASFIYSVVSRRWTSDRDRITEFINALTQRGKKRG